MRWRFDPCALVIALVLLVPLVLLGALGQDWGWVRDRGGDVLVIIWVYWLLRAVSGAPTWALAVVAFAVGCAAEAGQALAAAQHWHIANPVLRIALGSVADPWDVVSYAIGAGAVLLGSVTVRRIAARRRTAR